MNKNNLHCFAVAATELPLALLLEADPDVAHINSYLSRGQGYGVALNGETVAVAVSVPLTTTSAELINIAVSPSYQQQGIGAMLLRFVIASLRQQGCQRIELGTGTFGHQLTFYQRHGFRVDKVLKNHFIENYPEPIWESGIQHQDMLWLTLNL
ncbi:GNAT family N-acetyltransferase [Ferrimonas senticii]|uniref:GNAT family N-acetyltransferase n=1 Tax=Ferrimonas senticii TaxID=394566 RepID=UPI000421784B|nr:GNAT family N-acetyltransferase [Ferrimonas senticii]